MGLRRLLAIFLPALGVIAAAASPAWAAPVGAARDGMRWSLFLVAGAGLLLLVIGGEMWWLGRRQELTPADSEAARRGSGRR
jgi:hypothetical protein